MMHRHLKITLDLYIAFMILGLFSCKAQIPPNPPSPPATSNSVELLDFVSREIARIIRPGITTGDIEQYVNEMLKETKATLYFKGYHGYPSIITLSINDEVLSAPPSKQVLKNGDLLKMEFGLGLNGENAVVEWTFPVGPVSPDDQKLLNGTYEALEAGIKQARAGIQVSAVSKAIEQKLTSVGLSPNRDFVGYQIGSRPHMNPPIPAFFDPSSPIWAKDNQLVEGMTLAIIVVAHQGSSACYIDADHWTIKTKDASKAACFSRMVKVTKEGGMILTNEPHFTIGTSQ